MNIFEEIRAGQLQSEDMIKKSLPIDIGTVVEDIKKAKAAQVGEIRTWSGVKMRKEANGWVPVKDGSKGSGEAEAGKEGGEAPQDIAEAAKSASETALTNATKMSNDPKVREAAHKELMRRKSEEAQETFKAPEGAEGGAKPEASAEGKKTEPKKEEPKKEEKKPEAKKEEKDEELPFQKKMKEFKKEMAELGEKITNYKTQEEFDGFMNQIRAVTAEMKAVVANEMKSQGEKLKKDQEGKGSEKKEEGNKDKMLNEYGVHKGFVSIKNNGEFDHKPQTGSELNKQVKGVTSVSSEEEKSYIDSLPIHKMDEVPKVNPDKTEDNYVIETSDGTKYLVDTQGYDYPRYMTKLVSKF